MYSEKTFKNYIFWIQVKRVVLIILLSCIGSAIGVLVSELYESITKSNTFNVLIIVVSTILMFLLSLLCTAGTGKEVQDGYWKIAVLRKLTAIQKSIETKNALLGNNEKSASILSNIEELDKAISTISDNENEEQQLVKNDELEYQEDVDRQDNKKDSKKKKSKAKKEVKKETKKVKEVV